MSGAWYRVEYRYGPGRQSSQVDYPWAPSEAWLKVVVRERQEELNDWEYGPCVVKVRRLRGLRPYVFRRKVERAQAELKSATEALALLSRTRQVRELSKTVPCRFCKGKGELVYGQEKEPRQCHTCKGKRRVPRTNFWDGDE